MYAAKEKISNMASAAKEHLKICGARVEEKSDKARAKTKEEKVMIHERKKAKEAQAKMELHQEKAQHAQQKLSSKYGHFNPHHHNNAPGIMPATNVGVDGHNHHHLGGTAPTMAGTTVPPAYPIGGNPPGRYNHF